MTDKERQKLIEGLRHAAAYNSPICDAAAEEIERLAAALQSDTEPSHANVEMARAKSYAKGFQDGLKVLIFMQGFTALCLAVAWWTQKGQKRND